MSWLAAEQTDHDYVHQLKQDAPMHYHVLRVLALAIRIEPLLLRNARLQFAPGSDIELETEIWFSPIMHSRNAKACIIRSGIARVLVDDLGQCTKGTDGYDYPEALAFVEQHTRHWPGQDQLELQLRLAARKQDSVALKNGFNKILATLLATQDDSRKRDLSRWFKGAVPSMLDQQEPSDTAHLLFQYTAAALGLPASWTNNCQAGTASMPPWLQAALPSGKENSLGIQLHNAALECVSVDKSQHTFTVKLPLPTPVLLNTDQDNTPRWESLWLGRKIPLSPNYTTLSLQTLDGQLYQFTVTTPTPVEPTDPITSPVLQLLYMPEDTEQAYQIADLLKQQGIVIELIPEPSQDQAPQNDGRPVLRLWSHASARHWQQFSSSNTENSQSARALLVRTDPQVQLPSGYSPNQAIDIVEWQSPERSTDLVAKIKQWLENPGAGDEAQPISEIEQLLKELENPETKPRRRLAIGDRLAELGDPRKGVGVKEYVVYEYAPQVQSLLDELNDINTQPPRRLEIGNQLAEMGDPRFGVGLDENGLPEIDWVDIPAGPFIYGEGETQQTLDLPAFKISRYPVTNRQFQAFIDAGGYQDERWWQGLIKPEPIEPEFKLGNRPRENVDWFEALAYNRWLSEQLGAKVSLPTEQQWEKAARGNDGRVYPWGNDYRSGFANHDETRDKQGSYYLQQTSAVGIYPQGESPYHLADMAGNVLEWCVNEYNNPDKPVETGLLPELMLDSNIGVLGEDVGRVLRGGSWSSRQGLLRSALRNWNDPDDRASLIGFRLALDLPS